MLKVWRYSVLLCYLSAEFWELSIATVQTATHDEAQSENMKTNISRSISATISNATADIANPFDNTSGQDLLHAMSEIWNSSKSSSRQLRQIDQIFQQSYWLVGCDEKAPDPAAARLKRLVTQIRLNLRLVIREAQRGVASQFGFQTFFKTNDNIPRVVEIFKKIANGEKVRNFKPKQRTSWLMPRKVHPIIGCASTTGNQVNDEAYRECQNPPRFAYQPLGSAWIYLCPSFWDAVEAPLTVHCPEVHNDGTLVEPDDLGLHMSQQAIFVHELVHMYLGLPFQSKDIVEQYTVGGAMGLSSEETVENASNYGYFYSAVIAACSRLPHDTRGTKAKAGGL